MEVYFPGEDYREWDEKITLENLPTSLLVYPLTRPGERLPFSCEEACFFQVGKEQSREEFYAACLEGVGYVERLSLELLESLGADSIIRVFTSGGGSRSPIWRKIRANILNRPIFLAQTTESALVPAFYRLPFFGGRYHRRCKKWFTSAKLRSPILFFLLFMRSVTKLS